MWVVGMGSRPRFHGGQALLGNNGGRDGSPPPVFTGAGSRRGDNEGKGCEIPGLRCAALGMTCGPGRMSDGFSSPREQRREGWVPASARTTRGRGRVPVPVCTGGRLCAGTTEGGMGPRPPVFTGAGSRRGDNEGKGNCSNGGMSGKREEGAVPGCEIPGLRCAALGMICG